MVKNRGKKNVTTYDSFFYFNDVLLKFIAIFLIHSITTIRLSMAQKFGLLVILFIQLLANKLIRLTKIPPFDEISVTKT